MKLTAALFLFCLVSVSASTYSQNTRFDISIKNSTLVELFKEIESKSEFYFFYQKDELKNLDQITVTRKNATVMEILDEVIKGTDLNYKVVDRYIIIKKDGSDSEAKSDIKQQNVVTGKIASSSGEPLPGVTVLVKGTNLGTVTDADGRYSLANVPPDATLVFSFVGMKTQEIPVSGKTIVNVTMAEDAIGIEEVVAIGYGTQKKVNLTGAVSTVKGTDLALVPVASTTNALTGRVSGLISTQQSGQPGADAALLSIRGFSSPLVIVDGVESSFNNIDANEIESISVLKDASAAIYGARAGNGVVLVTTKRGTLGKPTITLNSSWTFQGLVNVLTQLAVNPNEILAVQ